MGGFRRSFKGSEKILMKSNLVFETGAIGKICSIKNRKGKIIRKSVFIHHGNVYCGVQ